MMNETGVQGCYAAYIGSQLLMLQDNLLVSSSRVKRHRLPKTEDGPRGCPVASINN
jgi:hypothetical protein